MESESEKFKILLCFSGSVATVKVPQIYLELSKFATVKMIASSNAALFFLKASKEYKPHIWEAFVAAGGEFDIVPESLEWSSWKAIGDPVVHIELRRWANAIIVAPASADLMAKIACGQSDSLMLSVLRAWDFAVKPAFLCPAMNTVMWEHPVTDETHRKLADWGYNVVKPASKRLACNDVGAGALADVDTIVREVKTLQLGWNIVHENSDFLDSFFEKQRILFITGRKAGDNDNSMVIQMTALSVDTAQVAQPTGTTVLATGGLKYDNSTENGSRSLLRNIICFIALSAVISMVQN